MEIRIFGKEVILCFESLFLFLLILCWLDRPLKQSQKDLFVLLRILLPNFNIAHVEGCQKILRLKSHCLLE